ncbi:MAG: hypothetical protein SVZ03_13360 [Spirochaetota bacterium]|nr:hypothetical protein [Spirochaetota bacterium]
MSQVDEIYDDNITYADKNKINDFITELIMGLGVKHTDQTMSLKLIGHINQQIYIDNCDFNNNFQDININFNNELTARDQFTLKNLFIRDKVDQSSFEDEFGNTDGRYTYNRNRLNLTYSRFFSEQLALSAHYSNKLDQRSRSDLSDSYFNSPGLEFKYSLIYGTTLSLLYEYEHIRFKPGDDASAQRATAKFTQYFTDQIHFQCKTGLDFIVSYNNKHYTKPFISASIVDDIDDKSSIRILFIKQYYFTTYSQDVTNNWRFSGSIKRQLRERLSCNCSCFYGFAEFVFSERTYNLVGVDISFNYDIRETIESLIQYTYSQRNSDTGVSEYVKNRVLFGIKIDL